MSTTRAAALGAAFAILLPAGLAMTGNAAPAKAPAAGAEVQEVDSFETVQPQAQPLSATTILGRLHPAFVHFPIGWLVALALIDILTFLARRSDSKPPASFFSVAVLRHLWSQESLGFCGPGSSLPIPARCKRSLRTATSCWPFSL